MGRASTSYACAEFTYVDHTRNGNFVDSGYISSLVMALISSNLTEPHKEHGCPSATGRLVI